MAGGLFVPTTTALDQGETVIVELAAPALPNKVLIRGEVKSWRPALPRLRVRAGAVVEFDREEAPKRDFIRDALSGRRTDMPRRRHNRLPVSVPCRYRLARTAGLQDGTISEISVGGAMLNTTEPIPIDSDVILEIVPPGAAAPISISSKVSYHIPDRRHRAEVPVPRRRRLAAPARAGPAPARVVTTPGAGGRALAAVRAMSRSGASRRG